MPSDIQSIPFKRADGGETTLAEHAGKVVLVVNVASKCGLTPQYDGLQALHARYKDKGLQVVGFPANEFLAQEPGTDSEIQQFCRLNYGVEFPVYAKLVVKGEGIHPLYAALTQAVPEAEGPSGFAAATAVAKNLIRSKTNGSRGPGDITWNFEKFILDRRGQVAARFAPDIKPEDPALVEALEAELAKPA
jgi:glutathione peroxidase